MKANSTHHISHIIVLLLSVTLLVSCRPKGILHSWEMRAVLVDLHKTDALIQISGLQYGYEEEKDLYYAQVLEKHGITQAKFDSSLVWYTAHPQLFDKIYPRVLKQLASEKEAFERLHAEELNLQPTIQKGAQHIGTPQKLSHPALTPEQLDSTLWAVRHGYPTLWTPYIPD